MVASVTDRLRAAGIVPSAQRVAVAEYVLHTHDHPTADRVWTEVQSLAPAISRATVYNTLNLFVAKGLLRQCVLTAGSVVFDPNTEPHHHLVDEETGAIIDVPWDAIEVSKVEGLPGFEVSDYQVVMRGRVAKRGARKR